MFLECRLNEISDKLRELRVSVGSLRLLTNDGYHAELIDELSDGVTQMLAIIQEEWNHPPTDDEDESEFEDYSQEEEMDTQDDAVAPPPKKSKPIPIADQEYIDAVVKNGF